MNRVMRGIGAVALATLVLGTVLLVPSPSEATPAGTPTIVPLNGEMIVGSSPSAADFNGDGYKEIVVGGRDGVLHVVSFDGTAWHEVWTHQTNIEIENAHPPTHTADNNIRTSQAIADLDNDGHLEIVVTVGGFVHTDYDERRNGGVLVYTYEGDSPWSFSLIEPLSSDGTRGWPQPRIDQIGAGAGEGYPDGYWDGFPTSPAVGDLDGDGDLEVIVEGMDRRIHAWHHDGTVVAGWPISQWNGDPLWRGGRSSPALGDMDGDGLPEVVVGTMSPMHNGEQDTNATVWAINGDSSLMSGFPVQTEQYIHSSPALADIDGDGKLEIIVGSGQGMPVGRTNLVYAWNEDGTPVHLPGGLAWPRETVETVLAPPAIGDIDGDGEPEIVIGEGGYSPIVDSRLYAWNADGSVVPGFPAIVPPPSNSPWASTIQFTPILADYDGDGVVEILVTHYNAWGFVIVEPDGTVSDRDGHMMRQGLAAPPLVDDIDGDGLMEIVAASGDANKDGELRIWDEAGLGSDFHPWPTFHHDVRRTGLYVAPPSLLFPARIALFHQVGSTPSVETMTLLIRNGGGGSFDWALEPSTAAIHLSPLTGTLETNAAIYLSVDTAGLPMGWSVVGTVTATATVAGADVAGSPTAAEVSLFVGDVQPVYLPLVLRGH